ncbi:MAG: type II secretion system F family protein [Clostridia bacterium]|nr:type II secretion system F family protein [Clostridia bacterium]
MEIYKYKAKSEEGKTVRGLLEANDETDLYTKLRNQGMYLLEFKASTKDNTSRKMKAKVLSEFCRSIGTLLSAGVSLVRALSIVSQEETTKPQFRKIYERVLISVRQGNTLSNALEEQGNTFPPLMINMFRSAEASGNMDKVAMRMAGHYEKEYRLKSKVTNAMVYPCILLILIVVVVVFIFTFVIPQFEDMFSQMESLPIPTQIVMGCSNMFKNHWLMLLIILVVFVAGMGFLMRIPSVKVAVDHFKLKMPLFGKLLKVVYTARFARTLSSLYSSGLPIVMSLQIGQNTIGNEYIASQFPEAITKVRAGMNLSEALAGIDGFTNKLVSSIMIGEETGSLDNMLDSMADTLEYESEMAISKMVTFMEPVLIVVMALIVGLIVISVIMPIYGSYSSVEGSAY